MNIYKETERVWNDRHESYQFLHHPEYWQDCSNRLLSYGSLRLLVLSWMVDASRDLNRHVILRSLLRCYRKNRLLLCEKDFSVHSLLLYTNNISKDIIWFITIKMLRKGWTKMKFYQLFYRFYIARKHNFLLRSKIFYFFILKPWIKRIK